MNFRRCFLLVICCSVLIEVAYADEMSAKITYCNPLPLPNYPIGRAARGINDGEKTDEWQWKLGYKRQFRELADVTALWFDQKWYLYPSVDMAWVSEDCGATWKHHPLNVRDIGYAPTIVRHRNKFLLMASESAIYSSDSPLGPFESIGQIELARTTVAPRLVDPMLYSDSDNRLYLYWGCTPNGGIWGIELDAERPTKVVGVGRELIPFRPEEFPWEGVGKWNQNPNTGWMEGAWMLKRNEKYFLTYCAGGTENETYAMGCYVGDSPLGPFVPQKCNPILRSVNGLITGTAHGSIVSGPNDELWAFYSVRASVVHAFERRLGMDRAEINADGELVVQRATSFPQAVPVIGVEGSVVETVPWVPLNGEMQTVGSSNAPNLEGRFAVDDSMQTWWQSSMEDQSPTLTTSFIAPAAVHAFRVIWRDVGLETDRDVTPGPVAYRIEVETSDRQWKSVIDRTQNSTDLLIDYCECQPIVGNRARLIVISTAAGISPAVAEFTVFGKTIVNK